MSETLTITELERRWEKALTATDKAVARHPAAYRKLKSLAENIVAEPLDIQDYLPTATKLVNLLQKLDPKGQKSIFHFFNDRISPSSVWHVKFLRVECNDLLAHLKAFNEWRLKIRRLKIMK